MTERMPVVFVSHGAPDALLKAPATVSTWRRIAAALPRPKGILVLSAHWLADTATVGTAVRPDTIHDFAGFAPALHELRYPAPGSPELGARVVARFTAAGIALRGDATRGLDHGAWVPLLAMYPEADVPVTQLALPAGGDAADHLAIGTLLRPLRDEGILLLASGAITHNFAWLDWRDGESAEADPRARQFADWVGQRVERNDLQGLADYRRVGLGAEAHPSEEHFLPLFAALGAADGDPATRLQPPYTLKAMSMDCYVWSATPRLAP